MNNRSMLICFFRKTIVRPRIGDEYHVGICGGCAEARYEVRFIFADGVHAYFQ